VAWVGIANHEMWRDELEIWLIAAGASGPLELLANMGTEGHPALWYVLIFVVTRFTDGPLAMQLLNLAFGTGAAFLVLRFAPFDLPQRLAFCFGYYLLYEFTVISRAYALGLLLAFAFCARFARLRRIDMVGGILLLLLANTTIYGSIVAAHVVLLAAAYALLERNWPALRRDRVGLSLGLAGVAVGLVHSVAQGLAMGQEHLGAYAPQHDAVWVARCLSTIFRGAVPLPDPSGLHTWNSHVLDLLPAPWPAFLGGALGVLGLALAVYSLRRQPLLAGVFALGTAVMLSVVFFVWFGWMRHHGQVFLWFFICSWLATALPAGGAAPDGTAPSVAASRAGRPGLVLTAVLATQVLAAAHAWAVDLALPFSNARAVGALLRQRELDGLPLVGSRDYAIQPVAAYAKRAFYYPESGRVGTFLDWGPGRRLVSPEEVLGAVHDLVLRERGDAVLVLNYQLPLLGPGGRVRLGERVELVGLASFTGAIVADEDYSVWRASLTSPIAAGDNDVVPDD